MPDLTSNATTLQAAYRAVGWCSTFEEASVWSGSISADASEPYFALAVTGGAGAHTDVVAGMEVIITNSSDVYKGRLRVSTATGGYPLNSTSLPVNETSIGTLKVISGDKFSVVRSFRLHDMLVSNTDDFNKDSRITYGTQNETVPPLANAGGLWVGMVDSGQAYATVQHFGSLSAVVDEDSGGTITHVHDVKDGTITVGTSTTANITVQYPVGTRWMDYTATDSSNSATATKRVPVRVHDADNPPMPVKSIRYSGRKREGWSATITLYGSCSIDDLPEGALIAFWHEAEYYGTTAASYGNIVSGRSHIKFVGWIVSESITIDPDNDEVTFEAVSPMGLLDQMTAFSQNIEAVSDPSTWQEYEGLSVRRMMIYILRWHTTLLNLFDVVFDLSTEYTYPSFYMQESTPLRQLRELADGLSADFTCDRLGRFTVARNLQRGTSSERSAAVAAFAWTTAHIKQVRDWGYAHRMQVREVEGKGFSTAGAPMKSIAPGTAPAEAGERREVERLIQTDQTELNRITGDAFAEYNSLYNNRFVPRGLQLEVRSGYDVFDPAYPEWHTITLAATTNRRGRALAGSRFILQSVEVSLDADTGVKDISYTFDAETSGYAGTTVIVETDTVAINPYPVYFPPVMITPGLGATGLTSISQLIAAFDSTNGKVHITSDFRTLFAGGTPTFTDHALGLTGTLASFAYKAGSSVDGYVATLSQVRSITDIFSARTLGTAYSYASGAAVAVNQVQLQSERGNPNAVLVAIYNDTGGVNAYRSADGSGSWSTESSLPSYYDTNLPNNAGTWMPGLWFAADGSGRALVSGATATDNPPGADFWETDDNGATWTKVVATGWNAGDWPCGTIVKPLNETATYHGYVVDSGSNALPGCGAGTYVWDYTADSYDAYDNSSGSTWVTGQGWYRTSVGAGATNYIIQPCDFTGITSISVRLTVTGNVSLNFGIGSAPRRVDNTLTDVHVDYTYAESGTASDVMVYLQMAASTSCYIERVTVVGTRTNCPTNTAESGIRRIVGTTQTDITPTYGGDGYGTGLGNDVAQRAISVADDDSNAVVVVGHNLTAGAYGVFQSFDRGTTWTTIVIPGTSVAWRGAYYTDRNTIYLIGVSGALGVAKYSAGVWTLYSMTVPSCGTIVGICGG